MKEIRDKGWAIRELNIQQRAKNKDKNFVLFLSKYLEALEILKFVRLQDDFAIYEVNGEWLRNNLVPDFEHAGHGYVHLSIPMNQIWVDTHHYEGCKCKNVRPDRKISNKNFESTVIHEPTEFRLMKKGMTYDKAHLVALKAERKAGILKNPYTEEYTDQDD